jgi:hypothetical protein
VQSRTYDRLAESVALIGAGRAEPVRRLSRRRPFAAMAVDVADDVAATMFARRGVDGIVQETHVLALRDGEWTWLGGGGGSVDQDLLADRPEVLPEFLGPHRVMAVNGGGQTLDDRGASDRRLPSERYVSHAILRVKSEVTSVQVADRLLVVPWHGYVIVVWSEPQRLRATALDEHGNSLAEVQLA